MKTTTLALAAALACLPAGPLAAAEYTLTLTAVDGRATYSRSQKNVPGERNDFAGKAEVSSGTARDIVFNTLLKENKGGTLLLDYTFELAGVETSSPAIRVAARVNLVPGKKMLAAMYGPWKLYLESDGRPPKSPGKDNYQLSADFSCGALEFPVRVSTLKGQRAEVVVLAAGGAKPRRFGVSLLPAAPDAKGLIDLQYDAVLTEDGAALGTAQDRTALLPGLQKTVPAGENCRLALKALSF